MLDRKPPTHFDDVMSSWQRELPSHDLTGMLLAIGLTRMGRIIDADFDRRTKRDFDIGGAEMRVLLALRRAGHPYARRPTDLFRALLISSGAITKQVDRLAAKDLVVRSPDPLHGGGFLIRLTPKGLKTANMMADLLARESILNDALADLDPATRAAGVAFCDYLVREVERKSRAGESDEG